MIKAGQQPGQGKAMRSKPKRRRSLLYRNPWSVLGIYLALMLAAIIALISFIGSYPNLPISLVVSETPVAQIVFMTPTSLASEMPQPSPVVPTLTSPIYTVKQGDTLYGIAIQFGLTVGEIKAVNSLSSDLISVGQQLIIPTISSTAPASTFSVATEPAISNPSRYQVRNGDTLESIAASHGLSIAELRNANSMVGHMLVVGQFISIPLENPTARPTWKFSNIEGNLAQDYPLTYQTDRFRLHYQPDTFPAQDPAVLAQLELNGLAYLESLTGLRLENQYDVYVAGTNFGPPNIALRGRGASLLLRTFFLHDGTGNPDDQQYIITHELTHLFMWNTVGSPSSTMLSEGVAVYFGMNQISASEHMSIDAFCAAYLRAGALPNISSSSLSYLGHILDLQNYYAAGSFVKYLVESYGVDSLKLVYHNGDYAGVYGKGITDLEHEWRIHLSTIAVQDNSNPVELVNSVSELEKTYESFFSAFSGSSTQLEAYRELDKARIVLLQGRLSKMYQYLDAFQKIVNGTSVQHKVTDPWNG